MEKGALRSESRPWQDNMLLLRRERKAGEICWAECHWRTRARGKGTRAGETKKTLLKNKKQKLRIGEKK